MHSPQNHPVILHFYTDKGKNIWKVVWGFSLQIRTKSNGAWHFRKAATNRTFPRSYLKCDLHQLHWEKSVPGILSATRRDWILGTELNEKKFLTLIQFQLRLLKPPSGEGPRTPKGRGDGPGEWLRLEHSTPLFQALETRAPKQEWGCCDAEPGAAPTRAAQGCCHLPALPCPPRRAPGAVPPGGASRSRLARRVPSRRGRRGPAGPQRADPPPVAGGLAPRPGTHPRDAAAPPTALRPSPAGAAAAGPGLLLQCLPGEAVPSARCGACRPGARGAEGAVQARLGGQRPGCGWVSAPAARASAGQPPRWGLWAEPRPPRHFKGEAAGCCSSGNAGRNFSPQTRAWIARRGAQEPLSGAQTSLGFSDMLFTGVPIRYFLHGKADTSLRGSACIMLHSETNVSIKVRSKTKRLVWKVWLMQSDKKRKKV